MAGGRKPSNPTRRRQSYDGAYPPQEFFVPASDSKGHSERAHIRLPNDLAWSAQQAVNSRLFPFKDISDVYRWCIREGVKALNEWEEVPLTAWGQAEAAREIAVEVLHYKQYESILADLGEAFEFMRRHGALDQIRKTYGQVRAKFELMPSGFWRTKYLAELESRYGSYVDPKTAAAKRMAAERATGTGGGSGAYPRAVHGGDPAPPGLDTGAGGPGDAEGGDD